MSKSYLKITAVVVSLILLITFITTGCGANKEEQATTTQQETSSQPTPSKPVVTEPVKLKIFIWNGGWTLKDVDYSNNPWIEFVNKAANVKLDVNCPSSVDAATKFGLLLSSGDLPDVFVVSGNTIVKPYDGSLLSLDSYISKSQVLSAFHTKDMVTKAMTEKDGKVYLFRSTKLESKNPNMWNARGDLIDEVFGGKIPTTLDEWVACAKAVKAKYPNSTPFSSFGMSYLTQFFSSFGVDQDKLGYFQLLNGKVVNDFSVPEMKKCLDFYKMLYQEGLLDKTFATNKVDQWVDSYENRQLLLWPGAMYASQPNTAYYFGKGKPMFFIDVPTVAAPGVDLQKCLPYTPRIGNYAMGVSSKTANKDAAVKVIETFCSPQFKEFITFGREGTEYTVVAGKKKLDSAKYNETHTFKSLYRFMWDFHTTESAENTIVAYGMDNLVAKGNQTLYDKYIASWENDKKIGFKQADLGGFSPFEFYKAGPSSAAISATASEKASAIIFSYIMDKITPAEYDKQAAEFIKVMEPVGLEMQAYYDSNK